MRTNAEIKQYNRQYYIRNQEKLKKASSNRYKKIDNPSPPPNTFKITLGNFIVKFE